VSLDEIEGGLEGCFRPIPGSFPAPFPQTLKNAVVRFIKKIEIEILKMTNEVNFF